eukprot:941676_1
MSDFKEPQSEELDQSVADEFFGVESNASPSDDMFNKMLAFTKSNKARILQRQKTTAGKTSSHGDFQNDFIKIRAALDSQQEIVAIASYRVKNKNISKIVAVLAYLCSEVRKLEEIARSKLYDPLIMFGQSLAETDAVTDETEMGKFLPFLQDVYKFVKRVNDVATNIISQLAYLYDDKQPMYKSTFQNVRLLTVFERLGCLLRLLVTLDELVLENGEIAEAWDRYKKMMKYVRSEPEKYGLNLEKLRSFETLIIQLDRQVLSGNMFEQCISQDFSLSANGNQTTPLTDNRVLFGEFSTTLRLLTIRLEEEFAQGRNEMGERLRIIDLFALRVLTDRLFSVGFKLDRKLTRKMCNFYSTVPLVSLGGHAVWYPTNFLITFSAQVRGLRWDPKAILKKRKEYLSSHDEGLEKNTKQLYTQTCAWIVLLNSEIKRSLKMSKKLHILRSEVEKRTEILLNGILLAIQIKNMFSVNVLLHLQLGKSFRKANIRYVALCAEMLQNIRATVHENSHWISENISNMCALCQFKIARVLTPVLAGLKKQPNSYEQAIDAKSACTLALNLLRQSPTPERLDVISVAIEIAQTEKYVKKQTCDELRNLLWSLRLVSTFESAAQAATSTDCLYWAVDLLPLVFSDIYKKPLESHRLQNILSALLCTLPMRIGQESVPQNELREEIEETLKKTIIDPIARDIETDLRLHIHSVVLKQESLRERDVKQLTRFLQLKPLSLTSKNINIKQFVENALDTNFYNLSTVALHDWKIYAEMRALAREKYNLDLADVHLPSHSHYSEGLDVLEIMRNIHVFVARYNYNLNTQFFVERSFDQKHLNTINIEHVANSIRTHGTGIMNTTINFVYQFLAKKFNIFSEFLYDDHIKSRLMNEFRFFSEKKDEIDNRFPFDRADKFTRSIRKLGVSEAGLSYLDQFRRLITEIGNALGYTRMVRSGGLRHCSRAIKFVPDLDNISSFRKLCDDAQIGGETRDAAEALDDILSNLSANFAEGTDYFQLLVAVFAKVLR